MNLIIIYGKNLCRKALSLPIEHIFINYRAYLYQLLKDRFNFFQSKDWEKNPDYGSGGLISFFDIKPPQNFSPEKEFFGPRNVVKFAFGKAP